MQLLINLVAFKLGWLACILGGANDAPLVGTLIALAIVALHIVRSALPARELTLALIAGAIGAVWDSVLASAGLLSYASGTLFEGTAPYWIVAMWLLFATLLNQSLRWMHGRLILAAAVGAIGGPLAFFAGNRLGAVEFSDFNAAMLALAVGWGAIMPLLVYLAHRFDGVNVTALQPAVAANS